MRKKLFHMLHVVAKAYPPAMGEMVARGIAGYASRYTTEQVEETGGDFDSGGFKLLLLFSTDPLALERLSAPGVADELMTAVGIWLQQVSCTHLVPGLETRRCYRFWY